MTLHDKRRLQRLRLVVLAMSDGGMAMFPLVFQNMPVYDRGTGDRRVQVLGWQQRERQHRGDSADRQADSGGGGFQQEPPVYRAARPNCQGPTALDRMRVPNSNDAIRPDD